MGYDADENAQPVDQYTPPRRSPRCVRLAPSRGSRRRSLGHVGFGLSRSLFSAEEAAIGLAEEDVLRRRRVFFSSSSPPPPLSRSLSSPLSLSLYASSRGIAIIKLSFHPLHPLTSLISTSRLIPKRRLLSPLSKNPPRRIFTEGRRIRVKNAGRRPVKGAIYIVYAFPAIYRVNQHPSLDIRNSIVVS